MIYPLNVHKQSQRSGSVPTSSISKLIIAFVLLGCVALFFLVDWIGSTFFEMPSIISFFISLAVAVIIITLVVRYVIFDEAEMMEEYKKGATDSFSKYTYIRKDDISNCNVDGKKVNCFSFTSGAGVVALQFRYGSNDQSKSQETLNVFEKIFHVLSENNLTFRTIDVLEDFEQSDEFKRYINGVNSIQDRKLAKHLLRVADNVLKVSEEMANVSTVYLMISNKSSVQVADLEIALRQIFALVMETPTAFRSLTALNKEEFLEILRRFYTLEAIDFGMMKVMELSQDVNIDFANAVAVYRVTTTDGKVYTSDEVIRPKFNNATRRF